MDILTDIYDLVKDDELMKEHVGSRYLFNDFPDAQDIDYAYMTINPVVAGNPIAYADGKRIADGKTARVDIFVNAKGIKKGNPRILCADLMEKVASILDDHYYLQTSTFTPEYDKNYQIYRESRSFEINYYRSDF